VSWSIVADRDVCIGSGVCVTYAPGAFDQDGEAKVTVRDHPTDPLDVVQAAVEACPTRAITLTIDGDGGAA
jgi:ferredoxin